MAQPALDLLQDDGKSKGGISFVGKVPFLTLL